jgi:hypothetical protein
MFRLAVMELLVAVHLSSVVGVVLGVSALL